MFTGHSAVSRWFYHGFDIIKNIQLFSNDSPYNNQNSLYRSNNVHISHHTFVHLYIYIYIYIYIICIYIVYIHIYIHIHIHIIHDHKVWK